MYAVYKNPLRLNYHIYIKLENYFLVDLLKKWHFDS